ncbi:MAG: leucine--tRNA ligase [Minisyncoccia bacterium]
MSVYDHTKIEKKWQKFWEKNKTFVVKKDLKKKKFYGLIEFPYPSGDGIHMGHVRTDTAMDVICRKRRMEGYNVLYPIGWDAFGLPTENYAIKTGIHPTIVTKNNTKTFRRQLKSIGFSFDWSREINTSDPNYYKWTQWIFLKLYENGLAYKKKMLINWCPKCKIGLANEEVVDGNCERCGSVVEKREKEQWMLAITKYADRLEKDLDDVNYLEKIKIQQRNWIGKSNGAELWFNIVNSEEKIFVFTTRPDTLYGVTYVVLAPENKLIDILKSQIQNWKEVEDYIKATKNKSEIERTSDNKEKTGVELKGVIVKHPITKKIIPVYISDYVLGHYGTGAVMAVPAHDDRDYAFAKKYNLPIIEVISGGNVAEKAYTENGVMVNSGEFNGTNNEDAKKLITEFSGGKITTTYKLRDWIFSRQHYWGEPIPVVLCEKCGIVPLEEKDLPLKLPMVKKYLPTDTGESPLASISNWVNTKCPKCGGKAKRETDTMPNWAGSSWYYLRYTDPKNKKAFADTKNLKYWTPVDWYNGGMEHTTLHLLYSRFWHKFLYDLKLVPTKEPYQKRTSQGFVLGEDGEKMSKSRGNVINPDEIVKNLGADSLRIYEMFMGPFDQSIAWGSDNIVGSRRFLERVWKLKNKVEDNFSDKEDITILVNQTIKKVGEDIESINFNTAISGMMILANGLENQEKISAKIYSDFIKILSPFAPHICEEIWAGLGNKKSIVATAWPKWDASKIVSGKIKMPIQINGKVRGVIEISNDLEEKEVFKLALQNKDIIRWIEGKEIRKTIFVKNKIINFIV